jgi:hypothetical protein
MRSRLYYQPGWKGVPEDGAGLNRENLFLMRAKEDPRKSGLATRTS